MPYCYCNIPSLGNPCNGCANSQSIGCLIGKYLYASSTKDTIPPHIKRPCVKLLKSLYGLEQSGCQWFLKYSKALKQNGFNNTPECPSVFAKLTKNGPVIAPIYVDDTNIIGNPTAIAKVKKTLKSSFQMKGFGKVAQCISIEMEHLPNGRFIHPSKLIAKLLMIMNLENTKVRQTPLVRSTHIDTDL